MRTRDLAPVTSEARRAAVQPGKRGMSGGGGGFGGSGGGDSASRWPVGDGPRASGRALVQRARRHGECGAGPGVRECRPRGPVSFHPEDEPAADSAVRPAGQFPVDTASEAALAVARLRTAPRDPAVPRFPSQAPLRRVYPPPPGSAEPKGRLPQRDKNSCFSP